MSKAPNCVGGRSFLRRPQLHKTSRQPFSTVWLHCQKAQLFGLSLNRFDRRPKRYGSFVEGGGAGGHLTRSIFCVAKPASSRALLCHLYFDAFAFSPSSTRRRMATASGGLSCCFSAQSRMWRWNASLILTPTIGSLPVAGRPRLLRVLQPDGFAAALGLGYGLRAISAAPANQPTASVFKGSKGKESSSMRSQVEHSKVRRSKPRSPGEIRAIPILCLQVRHIGRMRGGLRIVCPGADPQRKTAPARVRRAEAAMGKVVSVIEQRTNAVGST